MSRRRLLDFHTRTSSVSYCTSSSALFSSSFETERERGGTRRRNKSKGRSRYSRRNNNNNNNKNNRSNEQPPQQTEFSPLPPLLTTTTNSPIPNISYYTCRHTYEDILIEEIQRHLLLQNNNNPPTDVTLYSPCPGLVCLQQSPSSSSSFFPDATYEPIYALQVLPRALPITAPSIKGLSNTLYDTLLSHTPPSTLQDLRNSDNRGALSLHGLVPGMFKGQKNPIMQRRMDKVTEGLVKRLKATFVAARAVKQNEEERGGKKWLLQVLLVNPEVAICSLTQCTTTTSTTTSSSSSTWPNWMYPAGLANVDLQGSDIPSSAYRKLMEALECMQCRPPSSSSSSHGEGYVVDLGASPGGWTAILRRMGCRVIAVDRSELASNLMGDDEVSFIKGDAFTFDPTTTALSNAQPSQDKDEEDVLWMVSDVIAYPKRVTELLTRWCGNNWASHMIVTVKFQGDKVAWEELEEAMEVGRRFGYRCRAKHFFNNKNEVTLMLVRSKGGGERLEDDGVGGREEEGWGLLGKRMYPMALPADTTTATTTATS